MTEYVIARSSETDPQGNPWTSFEAPSVARVGNSFDVVFRGSTSSYSGVFVDRAVTTVTLPPATLITDQDTITVPGLGSNLDITFVSQGSRPGISSGGHTVFDINVALQSKQVLLTKGPSASDLLRVVTYEGMAFTGTPSGSVLVTASPRGIAPNGDVGFRANITTTASGSGMFRWDALTSALQLVAYTGQQAPPHTTEVFNLIAGATNQPYVAEFGDTGRGVFRATIKPATGGSNSAIGIWVDDLVAGLSNVADTYTNAPGVSPLDPFGDFHAPAVNSTGGVAFRGCLSAGCTNDGIWAGPVGAVSLVALTNLVAPDPVGSDPGETFVDFSNPVLNEAGAIAFRASKTGMHTEGIWRRATQFGTGLRRIVQRGDMLRGTNLEFVAFGEDIAISDTAELAFTAMMSDDPNSTLDDELGLFTTFQLGANPTIVKIVKVGEAFDFTTSQTKMVKNILFHPGAYPMGNTGFIHVASSPSQSQAIGFALTFDDQSTSRALVLSTVE